MALDYDFRPLLWIITLDYDSGLTMNYNSGLQNRYTLHLLYRPDFNYRHDQNRYHLHLVYRPATGRQFVFSRPV